MKSDRKARIISPPSRRRTSPPKEWPACSERQRSPALIMHLPASNQSRTSHKRPRHRSPSPHRRSPEPPRDRSWQEGRRDAERSHYDCRRSAHTERQKPTQDRRAESGQRQRSPTPQPPMKPIGNPQHGPLSPTSPAEDCPVEERPRGKAAPASPRSVTSRSSSGLDVHVVPAVSDKAPAKIPSVDELNERHAALKSRLAAFQAAEKPYQ